MSSRKTPETPIPLPPEKIAEIKPPKRKFFKNLSPAAIERMEKADHQRSRLPPGIWWGMAGVIILFAGGFLISFLIARRDVSRAISSHAEVFRSGVTDLESMDTASASREFATIANDTSGVAPLVQWLGFLYHGGAGTIAAFMDVTRQFEALSEAIGALENDTFQFLAGQGTDFLSQLELIRDTLSSINTDGNTLASNAPAFGDLFAGSDSGSAAILRSRRNRKARRNSSMLLFPGCIAHAASCPYDPAESFRDPPGRRISWQLCGRHDRERHDHERFRCMILRMLILHSRRISFRRKPLQLEVLGSGRRMRIGFSISRPQRRKHWHFSMSRISMLQRPPWR